jgi:hypothetical protein
MDALLGGARDSVAPPTSPARWCRLDLLAAIGDPRSTSGCVLHLPKGCRALQRLWSHRVVSFEAGAGLTLSIRGNHRMLMLGRADHGPGSVRRR